MMGLDEYKAEVEAWITETYPEGVIKVALPALEAVADSEWDYYLKWYAPSDAAAEIVESALEDVRGVIYYPEGPVEDATFVSFDNGETWVPLCQCGSTMHRDSGGTLWTCDAMPFHAQVTLWPEDWPYYNEDGDA